MLQDNISERTLALCQMIGQFLAKALIDMRMADLPLCPVLFQLLLDDSACTLEMIRV